jgi:hypothetical protein
MLPKAVVPAPGHLRRRASDGLVDLALSVHGYTPGRYRDDQGGRDAFLGDSAVATSVAYQRIYERHLRCFRRA